MAEGETQSGRMSAGERRELVREAAVREFAVSGFHGTSAESIARRAGISQPYLFRLFGTKRELFLAVVDHFFDQLLAFLREAAEGSGPDDVLRSMQRAVADVMGEEEIFLLQLQIFAACGDDEVRFVVRRRFAECYEYVERVSGASADEARSFFAELALMALAATMRLSELASREGWARRVRADQA